MKSFILILIVVSILGHMCTSTLKDTKANKITNPSDTIKCIEEGVLTKN
jgi:hypothetical protein